MIYRFELYSAKLPRFVDGDEFVSCNFGREQRMTILPDDFRGKVVFRNCNLNFCIIDKSRMVIDGCLTGEHAIVHPLPVDVVQQGIADAGGVDAVLAKIGIATIKKRLNLVDAKSVVANIGEVI